MRTIGKTFERPQKGNKPDKTEVKRPEESQKDEKNPKEE